MQVSIKSSSCRGSPADLRPRRAGVLASADRRRAGVLASVDRRRAGVLASADRLQDNTVYDYVITVHFIFIYNIITPWYIRNTLSI